MKIVLFANTDWYLYNFRRSFALHLQRAGNDVLLVSPDGPYVEKIRRCGLRWIAAPMDRRSLNPVREVFLLAWLWRLIRRERVDLVHGFTIKCAVYAAIAGRMAGSAVAASVVGGGYVFSSRDWFSVILRPFVRALMRFAFAGDRVAVIVQNLDDAELVRQAASMSSPPTIVRGSGVDCAAIPQSHARRPGETLRVLMAARLIWEKGIQEYVIAAQTLKAQGRDICFLLAGAPDPGNPNAVPEAVVRKWADDGAIEWLGHVEDMLSLLASVHVLVLPSYAEGLPRALIEGAAAGLALVTTDAPGCREVVTHEVNGLRVPVGDSEALAAAIARLDDDSDLATRLGAAARENAVREFDEGIVFGRTLQLYEQLGVWPHGVRGRLSARRAKEALSAGKSDE